MDILGIPINSFIFSIFLPFVFFFTLFFALLQKSKIFGSPTEAKKINMLLSLTLSAIAIYSSYLFGLTSYFFTVALAILLVTFIGLFFIGSWKLSNRKLRTFYTKYKLDITKEKKEYEEAKRNFVEAANRKDERGMRYQRAIMFGSSRAICEKYYETRSEDYKKELEEWDKAMQEIAGELKIELKLADRPWAKFLGEK